MFKIADFSRLTRVTVKMLRHYDEIGLLRPRYVDPDTGYRYYAADQLPRLNRLIALKDLGFSLDSVAALLDDQLPLDELRGMLRLRRAELAAEIEAARQRLRQVELRLNQIEQEAGQPGHEVVLRSVGPQLVAAIRAVVPADAPISAMFDEAELFAARQRARAAGSPLMIYHDPEHREADLDVEVAVPLSGPAAPGGRVRVYELPGLAAAACVVYTGGYERGAEALQALMLWSAAAGYRAAGPLREVYLRFGAAAAVASAIPPAFLADQSALFVTEVQLPVEPEPS